MVSERWKQIEQVYYSVVASPKADRAALLGELCADDLAMHREVESLLDARELAGDFLSPVSLRDHVAELLSEQDLVGQTLGHYHILSVIGAGAMGEVYLARDARLDRQVAFKILPPRFTRESGRVARFRREAKVASSLNHPNIITIHDMGEIGETLFIAAEFIEGVTLRNRLTTGKMELSDTLGIAIQCARALEAAHGAGIVHRDVKPENIMVRPDGMVKVVDFGLARVTGAKIESAVHATLAGAVIGTPRYMSPEQARGERLDARTDVFSLGAVLYEMGVGRPAFPGATTAEVFAAILDLVVQPPSETVNGIPERFDAIVFKALQKDRDARYQMMQEFASDLQNLQHEMQTSRAISVSRTRSGERSSPPPFSRRVFLATGAGTAAALAIAWYAARHSNRREVPPPTVVPLTAFAGDKDFGSFSPDGNSIAFSWHGGKGGKEERSIYTKKIGPDDPVRLTFGPGDDRTPVWSPNGQYIAFCRTPTADPAEAHFGIYVIPTTGGKESRIAEGGLGVSWSPDNKLLALAGLHGQSSGIFVQSFETGKGNQLTVTGPYVDILPVFSPDGRWIAFTRDFGSSAREIFIVPSHGGTPRQLTFDREPTYGAAWTRDSREIVFSSNRGAGGESAWRVAADGGAPSRLWVALGGTFYPSVSRQGDRLVYTESFKDTNIYAYEGPGFGTLSNLAPESRFVPAGFGGPRGLIVSSRRDDSPSISLDGEWITFVSKRTGNEEIWISDRNGGRLLKLTSFKGPSAGTPRWSPDGRSIAFDSLADGNPDIYVIDVGGGPPRRLTTGPHGNFMPSWSPDGKMIYFKSDRSGSDQTWKVPAAGGTAIQLTRGGACEAFVAPDGKLVYYTKHSWGRIWTVPADGGREEPLLELERFDKIFRSWGVIDRGICFISRQDAPYQTIRFFSFATRQTTSLATLDKEPIWDYPDVALSNDGRLLLVACVDQEVNDLMLIENFH